MQDLDRYEAEYGDYGEQYEKRGGGGKRKNKGVTKSVEAQSQADLEALQKERQLNAESAILRHIDEAWKSFEGPDRETRISNYAKWMEKAARQKNFNVDEKEVRIKTKKSNGAGGQNVQKNETAITMLHIPTRIGSSSQDERSQFQNKTLSLKSLSQRLESHISVWKETSKEFRQNLIKRNEKSESDTSFEALPTDVSIGELRDQLPQSEELIVKFGWEGDSDGKPKIAYVGADQKYSIYPNTEYRININPKFGGDLYMNPVNTNGAAPEVSDIPRALDKYITSKKGRADSGISVYAKSDSGKVGEAVKNVQTLRQVSESYDKLKKFTEEYAQNDLNKTLKDIEDLLDLSKLQKGPRAYEVIFRQAWLLMEAKYIGQVREVGGSVDLKTLAEDSLLNFMQELKKIVDERPKQLKDMLSNTDQIAIHIDNIPIDPSEPDSGLMVVTTYIPERGWSIMVPIGDCPNLAANMLEKFAKDKLDQSENKTFYESTSEAEKNGDIQFSNDGRTIVFNKLDTLNPYMAVFHGGNDTLKEAMETLRVAGDPILGERTFKFLIYKDTTELVVQQMPPITLNFD